MTCLHYRRRGIKTNSQRTCDGSSQFRCRVVRYRAMALLVCLLGEKPVRSRLFCREALCWRGGKDPFFFAKNSACECVAAPLMSGWRRKGGARGWRRDRCALIDVRFFFFSA